VAYIDLAEKVIGRLRGSADQTPYNGEIAFTKTPPVA